MLLLYIYYFILYIHIYIYIILYYIYIYIIYNYIYIYILQWGGVPMVICLKMLGLQL